MVDVFGLRFLLFNQSCYVNGNIVAKILFGDLLSDHDEAKKGEARTSRDVLNKVIPNVDDKLISGKDLSH